MLSSKIMLQRVQPEDWKRLARLEVQAFGEEEFSAVAFGPGRFDEDVLEERAREMGLINAKPGEITRNAKAVFKKDDGTEWIVGYAKWQTVLVDEGGIGIYGYGNGKEPGNSEAEDKRKDDEQGKKEIKVKTVANEKLCDDLFIPGDQHMAAACKGRNYHSKS